LNFPNKAIRIARAFSFRNFGFPFIPPRQVLVGVTYLCNSRCNICGIWKIYQKSKDKLEEEMTLEEFETFLKENAYLEDITVTGGEPYLRKDIYDFFMLLSDHGYNIGTATNALATERIKSVAKGLLENMNGKNLYEFQISIDGLEDQHDRIRGVKGNFQKAISLLQWAMEEKKEFSNLVPSVSHTITGSNCGQLLRFIEFFVGLGLSPSKIWFRPAQLSSSYYRNIGMEDLPTNNDQIIKAIQKVEEKYDYYRDNLFYNGIFKYLSRPMEQVIPCYAGFTFSYIDPYWDVYPCISWPEPVDNLRNFEFDLAKFWKECKKLKEARKLIARGKCPNCWTECSAIPTMNSNGLTARRILSKWRCLPSLR